MRVRATVAYDGQPYRGFAANPGVRTVGGDLAEALAKCLRHPVELTCAGRTDTGVHAWGQVVSFDAADGADLSGVRTAVNRILGPSVAVREIEAAPEGFDARFDAASRTYRYTVLNREVPDPFLAATAWHCPHPLDIGAMNEAATALVGEHDFSSFCRRQHSADGTEKSRIRVVMAACWHTVEPGLLRFEVEASSFCHQMVRSIVGALVAIGAESSGTGAGATGAGSRRIGPKHISRAQRPGEAMASILSARDRARVPNLAPPHGLCLWSVTYQ